jgi:hypothetical protein
MFDPETECLFETEHGTVLHCACCRRFQVTFDEVVLLLDRRDFQRLLSTVETAAEQVRGMPHRWWRLYTPTDAGEVSVPVRSDELLELRDLLKGAAVMHELDDLLETVTAR